MRFIEPFLSAAGKALIIKDHTPARNPEKYFHENRRFLQCFALKTVIGFTVFLENTFSAKTRRIHH
jgi:hypothetical protein